MKDKLKININDFEIGETCSVNMYEDGIKIQIKLKCNDNMFLNWFIKDDYVKPIQIQLLNEGKEFIAEIKEEDLTKEIKLDIIKSIEKRINEYGLEPL